MADSLDLLWSMFAAYLRLTRKLDASDIVRITYLLSSVCSVNPRKTRGDWYNKAASDQDPLLVSLLALF